jgi:hypothetical protein
MAACAGAGAAAPPPASAGAGVSGVEGVDVDAEPQAARSAAPASRRRLVVGRRRRSASRREIGLTGPGIGRRRAEHQRRVSRDHVLATPEIHVAARTCSLEE